MPKRRKRNYRWLWGLCSILLAVTAVICMAVGIAKLSDGNGQLSVDQTGSTTTTGAPTTTTTKAPRPVSATIGSVGDILMHDPLVSKTNYYSSETKKYEYDSIFTHVKPYYEQMDLMVANFEGTLAGTAYSYRGYPSFNAPDDIIDAMVNSGVDMMLTANNHSFDTRAVGFNRTREVLKQRNIPFIGTRDEQDEPYYIANVNGIAIGMINYTYETARSGGRKTLNGIKMTADTENLINSFNYSDLNAFYKEIEQHIADMKKDGAEAIMLYIHWGNEYKLKPNSYQTTIAQKMCDLGVDVIVGGHPHVIQPIEILTSSVSGKKTVCAYSLGNELSNQRIAYMNMKSGHTEDGMILQTTFTKAADGTVSLTGLQALPTWVHMYKTGGKTQYQIVPLDTTKDFEKSFNLSATSSGAKNAAASYKRTMDLIGDGLEAFQKEFLD